MFILLSFKMICRSPWFFKIDTNRLKHVCQRNQRELLFFTFQDRSIKTFKKLQITKKKHSFSRLLNPLQLDSSIFPVLLTTRNPWYQGAYDSDVLSIILWKSILPFSKYYIYVTMKEFIQNRRQQRNDLYTILIKPFYTLIICCL